MIVVCSNRPKRLEDWRVWGRIFVINLEIKHMSNHRLLQMFDRSSDPALSVDTLSKSAQSSSATGGIQLTSSQTMALQGTVNKTGILIF